MNYVAAYVQNPGFNIPFINIRIHWYGVILAAAFLCGIWLTMYRTKKRGYNSDLIIDFAVIAIPLSIICARIYYVIFSWKEFAPLVAAGDWLSMLRVWDGGIAIYGGVIGGIISAIIFTSIKKNKISFWKLADIVAPGLILGQAIGRWGNFVNKEVYGLQVTNYKYQWFPFSVQVGQNWYLALFFYESVLNFAILAILLLYDKYSKRKPDGNVFLLYVLLYGAVRAWLEGLRMDQYALMLGSIRVSQLLSIIICVLSLLIMVIRGNHTRRSSDRDKYDESLSPTAGVSLDIPDEPEETAEEPEEELSVYDEAAYLEDLKYEQQLIDEGAMPEAIEAEETEYEESEEFEGSEEPEDFEEETETDGEAEETEYEEFEGSEEPEDFGEETETDVEAEDEYKEE